MRHTHATFVVIVLKIQPPSKLVKPPICAFNHNDNGDDAAAADDD